MHKFVQTNSVTFGIEFKAYFNHHPYTLRGLYKYRGNYYIPPAPPKDMMEQIRNRVNKYLDQKKMFTDSDVRVDISSWPQVLSSLKELTSYTKFDLIVDAWYVPPIGTTLESSKPKRKRKSKRKENYESYVRALSARVLLDVPEDLSFTHTHASEEQNSDDNEWIQVKNK